MSVDPFGKSLEDLNKEDLNKVLQDKGLAKQISIRRDTCSYLLFATIGTKLVNNLDVNYRLTFLPSG